MKKILMSSYMGMGNFIQSVPSIFYLKTQFPDVQVDFIGGSSDSSDEYLKLMGKLGNIYILKSNSSMLSKMRFYLNLRKNKYDLVIVPVTHEETTLRIFYFLIGAKKIILGALYKKKKETILRKLSKLFALLLPNVKTIPHLPGYREMDFHYDYIQSIMEVPVIRKYEFFELSLNSIPKYLPTDKFVVLSTSARYGEKTPKLISFDVVNKLIGSLTCQKLKIVVVGTFDGQSIQNQESVLDLRGKTSISDLCLILKHSEFCVFPDTGPMHLANSLGVKVLGVYGPTDFYRTAPIGRNTEFIFSDLTTDFIMFNYAFSEDDIVEQFGVDYCMKGITDAKIIEKLKALNWL